jgi:hypothetical protein
VSEATDLHRKAPSHGKNVRAGVWAASAPARLAPLHSAQVRLCLHAFAQRSIRIELSIQKMLPLIGYCYCYVLLLDFKYWYSVIIRYS